MTIMTLYERAKNADAKTQVDTLIYYAEQFGTPRSDIVKEVRKKVRPDLSVITNDQQYKNWCDWIDKLIEERVKRYFEK